MGEKTAISEERTTAASYILTFYQDVIYLTHNYSLYLNELTKLGMKYNTSDVLSKMEEVEKQIIIQLAQNVRYYIHKCYIQYNAVLKAAKFKEDRSIEEIYKKLRDVLIINRHDLEKYVIAINQVLVNNVMKSLLESSQDIVENIYKE